MVPNESRDPISADDPRLTAYALGELEADDTPAVEALLAQSPAARAEVEAIRAMADRLGAELAAEPVPGPGLDADQKRAIEDALVKPKSGAAILRPWLLPAIAAALLISLVLWSERNVERDRTTPGMTTVADAGERDASFLHDAERGGPRAEAPAGAPAVLVKSSALDDARARAPGLSAPRADIEPPAAVVNAPASARIESESLNRKEIDQLIDLGYISADMAEPAADDRPARSEVPRYRYWKALPVAGSEGYEPIVEQGFQIPVNAPLSTFSIDVDTASYANVRRFLQDGRLPPVDAVRIEELVNYFDYDYSQPDGDVPFAVDLAVTEAPWAPQHRLVRIGLAGREIPVAERAPSNLVFLVDVSGSMQPDDKLPLLVASLKMLVGELDQRDRVALVTYAGNAGLVLDSTSCREKGKILAALDNLRAGGSTHGSRGIQLAYEVASKHFIKGGTNRVILATDGDFNVGLTDRDALQRLIEQSAKSRVFLSVLLFGTGNIKDDTAELLADRGNGNYSYIDSFGEARKVLVQEMGGTLITIAKDVKVQVEFNPAEVGAYRLIGYENRALAARDFNDDRKDAGEIGAGHSVTALYEIVPTGAGGMPGIDPLKYQQTTEPADAVGRVSSDELLTVKLRWKEPDGEVSSKIEVPLTDAGGTLDEAGSETAFAAAVACYGMLLRRSDLAGDAGWDTVLELAERGRGKDRNGYRAEFIQLAKLARRLSGQ